MSRRFGLARGLVVLITRWLLPSRLTLLLMGRAA
jgi:hypothetical protein